MLRFASHTWLTMATIRRASLLAMAWLLAASGVAAAAPSNAKDKIVRSLEKPDSEVLLTEVYKALTANNLREAQSKADALVAAYPNFRLGHLIRGDLLLMHVRPVTTLGAVGSEAAKAGEALRELREEATARLKSLLERPGSDLMPRPVLQLRQDQKHVLVVDTKHSRLYVYENQSGQPKLINDYYMSQGKYGADKFKEGDKKTPLGIYYITDRLPSERLPEFYGAGALPINYPNEWDRLRGRGGSGIWLHGAPPNTFSRPPLALDGCVVLTNVDFRTLYTSVEINKTPVVITDDLEFVSKTKWNSDRTLAAKLIEGWRRDLESLEPKRLMENYSRQFKSERGKDLATWFEKRKQSLRGIKQASITLADVTLFIYLGKDNTIVATFTQNTVIGKTRSSMRKRQYWLREGPRWKIISEIKL